MASGTQIARMLTRDQLLHLFDRFIFLTSQPGSFHNPILLFLLIGWLIYYSHLIFALSQSMVYADVKKRIAGAVQDKQVNFFVVTFLCLTSLFKLTPYLRYKATFLLSSYYIFSFV